jgi:hypothetical protein
VTAPEACHHEDDRDDGDDRDDRGEHRRRPEEVADRHAERFGGAVARVAPAGVLVLPTVPAPWPTRRTSR